MQSVDPLRHHGDVDAAPGMLDFAVNVQGSGPGWLRDRIAATLDHLGRYPAAAHDAQARAAVAARHGRRPDEVLVLAGAAEGFALLPALAPRLVAIVHPGFTEPELALRTAGVPVVHVLTDAADGHRLHPEAVPVEADLVVVGNPSNPTEVLHPAAALQALAAPGRVVVVDEAFADAVPGEPESVAGDPGFLVFRSLTKTWALAGLRPATRSAPRSAGPAGDEPPALAGVDARAGGGDRLLRARAVAEAELAAHRLVAARAEQAAALAGVPGVEVLPGRAPFLLLRLPDGQGERVRAALRSAGIAVRRCDTFPGLGPDHLRVAVRPAPQVAQLVVALTAALAQVTA